MRAYSMTTVKGGISRLRTKGSPSAQWLYELLNGYVTEQGTIVQRDGTSREPSLPSTTRGLCAFEDTLHTFSHQQETLPAGYTLHVLYNPADDDVDDGDESTLTTIHFAQPFLGALYVVAEWSDDNIVHYWLSSSGDWTADNVYRQNDVVEPTVPNGFLYKAVPNNPSAASAQTWTPNTARAIGDRVLPTEDNGYYYEVIATDGAVPVSGSTEPGWIASEGAVVIEAAYSETQTTTSQDQTSVPQVPGSVADRYGTPTGSTSTPVSSSGSASSTTTVQKWAPGTLYSPGDLVTPLSSTPAAPSAIPNANFESGDTGWTKQTGWHITNSGTGVNGNKPYQGAWFAYWNENEGQDLGYQYLEMSTKVPVQPGQFVSGSCYDSRMGGNNSGMDGMLVLRWYDDLDVLVYETEGTFSGTNNSKDYRLFTVQDIAPGGATQLAIAYKARGTNDGGQCSIDGFVWDYQNLSPIVADYTTYQATQASPASSGTEEPVWPGAGNSVVDNGVTWLGGVSSTVTWQAYPIMKSGSTEPTWAEQANSSTTDNTISWQATSGYVEQAPASKIVAIAAKKVFAADADIVRYSATVNPLDWTTAEDAGYLPVGLNTHGANPTAAMNLYRGNLVPFNTAGFQMWQIDEDPALMSLLDAVPIGSSYHDAAQPVKNDLLFLTNLGVRNISIAGASTNLQAGSVGDPVDSLVVAKLRAGEVPKSVYYPARGQYWLWFGDEAFVLTMNDNGEAWSRYVFPEALTNATLLNDDLYLRTETHKVWKVNPEKLVDDALEATVTITIASPGVLTAVGHGLVANDPVTLTTTGALPTGLVAGTTYYVRNPTADTFELSAISGGASINTTGTQSGVHTLTYAGTEFEGVLQWPHLDCGPLGVQKMMSGFDLACTGEVTVQVGYDQRDFDVLTTGYLVSGDTLPGTPIPLPVSASSFSLKLTFSGNQAWEWYASNLYMNDFRGGGFSG